MCDGYQRAYFSVFIDLIKFWPLVFDLIMVLSEFWTSILTKYF